MPIQTALWKVGKEPTRLVSSVLPTENLLEEMIVKAPHVLSEEWMLIGRQENTGLGGRVDLVAIAPDSSLVLIELKRDRTPREVVAQALDYAGWLEGLGSDEISAMYQRFSNGGDLMRDFRARFGTDIVPEELNQSHQIIVVASSLDDSTERIVKYLSKRDVAINVMTFQVFALGEDQVLSRTWLVNPTATQIAAATNKSKVSEPWNGEFYCSFGEGSSRNWDDAVRFGFVSGGGGSWYSRTLDLLNPGDRVWAKVPKRGFVGVGTVIGRSTTANDFLIETSAGQKSILDVPTTASYHSEYRDDPEKAEYFVPIQWHQTVPAGQAVNELGFFGNQNTICQPTTPKWRSTVDRLKQVFPKYEG